MPAAKPTITQEQLQEAMKDPWNHIKKFITAKGLTTKQVSEETNIPWSTIRSWMNGNNGRDTPSGKNLAKIINWYLNNVGFSED